ncbi:uncharacterized protein LOC110445198 isoform X2 [Mizuhopecten yessoensis]|uniref:Uncharacterized protein n=1 Tax=Mizuhopecten yessoensis TaxID=6573 RepID=A0A210R034_MIZYE|nr:uncharacterized protein LOC110445198 isoform X2 [Mizuhopecten yessoensis]XP_021345356.1 uncharacterized protein LOC110445198 isoform X2 [Mizuhopecten yessoensis]OWF54378.1 hypothetical protein KP79_PYT08329 [Mizuhopecten yessoensis]
MIAQTILMATILTLVTSCPNDAVSKDFLDYLDDSVLHYCESSKASDYMTNRTALIDCIKVRYHSLKVTMFGRNFASLSNEALDKLEGYFVRVVGSCWNASVDHTAFNDCVATTYYATYNYTENHHNGDISKEFLDFLKCNLLIPCETDPDVPSDDRHALIACIREDYHQLKAYGFSSEFSAITSDSLDGLERYFVGVVMECWDDSISHTQFNKCVGDTYYHNYGYNQRTLIHLITRFLNKIKT